MRDENVVRLCLRCKGRGALLVHANGDEEPLPDRPAAECNSHGIVCADCNGSGKVRDA